MTIRIWADVGGTFTDCILNSNGEIQTTKVLSSGLVRFAVHSAGNNQFQIESSAYKVPADFWKTAQVDVLGDDGIATPLGRVSEYDNQTNVLSVDAPHRLAQDQQFSLQINTGLEAPVLGARILLGCPLSQTLPPLFVRMGTTRGTNALLTRSGVPTALLITRGFADCLLIGEQDRPELFELSIRKPAPLTNCVVEIDERLDAQGNVLHKLNINSARQHLQSLQQQGIESLAICLMHAYLNDEHERQLAAFARELGFTNISRSSEVAPLIKLVPRAETTTLDAYLNPILQGYVGKVWQQFGGAENCHLRLMTSGGNLVQPDSFRGRDSILSGPAGGVVALAEIAQQVNVSAAIGLDMGGTSTDVSRYQGKLGRRYETRVSGVRVVTPMMDIETVAAGGGSICEFQHGRLSVGPSSAGADPGPACYGRGGPATITDCNLVLGRIRPERFPFPIDVAAARTRLHEIATRVTSELGENRTAESLAEGFLEIAVTHMAEAVRSVSTAEGSDVREMALVGFGGAAAQHLCQVAEALGMNTIIDHPSSSVLSALGMGLAKIGRVLTRGIYRQLAEVDNSQLQKWMSEIQTDVAAQLTNEDTSGQTNSDFEIELRYVGTDSTLAVKAQPGGNGTHIAAQFHRLHQKTFGYHSESRSIEIVGIRCEVTIETEHDLFRPPAMTTDAKQEVRFWHAGQELSASLIDRASLNEGDEILAPTIVTSDQSSLIVLPGWSGCVESNGAIRLVQSAITAKTKARVSDPVLLEIISRRLQGIADAMGEALRRTAISVNIRERRDYSCAVFRGDGSLIANAPHVPVHLGAMGHTVRRLIDIYPSMHAGDCYLSNDPFAGGSHLPDITAVTPVFCNSKSGKPDFFVASRAHHAEIGGRTPGSMPPNATSLAEEGVVIRDFALVRDSVANHEQLRDLLASGTYPSRTPNENLADIAAQQAAGVEGSKEVLRLVADYDVSIIDQLMGRILDVAAGNASRFIESLPHEPLDFCDALDDGTPICVSINRNHDRLSIDFRGTADVHPKCFNATPSIVTAAVLYSLRCLSDTQMPLCDGVLRNIDLRIPAGLLNPPNNIDPEKCAAVVAGNVETSQRIVDVLFGAFSAAAASQGTMNNLLIGDETFGYYETICGGSGATKNACGASAVHTHMTNTRITDPEVFETRLPARLLRFEIRNGSGGDGRHRGGDGIIREIEFLRPLTVSLITNRRKSQPYGMDGGQPGSPGKNQLKRNGKVTDLAPATTIQVRPSDRLVIQTPGGGGYGKTNDES